MKDWIVGTTTIWWLTGTNQIMYYFEETLFFDGETLGDDMIVWGDLGTVECSGRRMPRNWILT